jgi:hypothetical protein
MSTQGSGAAVVVGLPIVAGVGLGIAVVNGVMYCDQQLNAWYLRWVQEQETKVEAARAWDLSHVEQMRNSFVTRIETLAMAKTYHEEQETEPDVAEQEALRAAIAQVQAALADAGKVMSAARDSEREALLFRLEVEIAAARAIVPARLVAQAEQARGFSIDDIRVVIGKLEQARQSVETSQMNQNLMRSQLQHNLRQVRTQLEVVSDMLAQVKSASQPEIAERQRAVEHLLAEAQKRLDGDLEAAKKYAEEAQRVADLLKASASALVLAAWDNIRRQVNTQLGNISALQRMLAEAETLQAASPAILHELTNKVTSAYNEANAIGQLTSLNVQRRLDTLAKKVTALKDDIFALLGTYQQRTIAGAIATTLEELGYQSADGATPAVQENGDVASVVVTRMGQAPDGSRDDKLIAFDVSRTGQVAYDFSGFTGQTCLAEAEAIFAALRARGVYLLEPQAADHLQQAYAEGITQRVLNQPRYHLHPEVNKLQTELAERIQSVLEQMHYAHIQQRAVGGCIEFDAFNGSLGYHVVLDPEGEMQVFKDGNLADVTGDLADPLVAEVQQGKEIQEKPQQTQPRQRRNTYSEQRKRNLLEH